MSRKTHRAGAFAAAMMFMSLVGAGTSGAFAEDQIPIEPNAAAAQQGDDALLDSGPRFVVQDDAQFLPDGQAPQEEPVEPQAAAASLQELVAGAADQPLSRDMTCLAQAVYFEARGEPLDGQLAVAEVIINRAESPLFPEDYCGVVTQRSQFSFVRSGHIPSPDLNSGAWRKAKAIARIAHEETWESPAREALFFHANYVRPSWARTKLAAATIDSHVFYK